jgi:hypothetical protein
MTTDETDDTDKTGIGRKGRGKWFKIFYQNYSFAAKAQRHVIILV